MNSERKSNKPSPAPRGNRRAAGADRADRKGAERDQHVDAFKKRELRPGSSGLANEARPGLGTRADEGAAKREEGAPLKPWRSRATKAAKSYREPPPAPQEEPADELVQEQERSTGMSGQSAGT